MAVDEPDDDEEGLNFSVAPWAEAVEARPIFVVSDGTGISVRRLCAAAWAQFGPPEAAQLFLRSGVGVSLDAEQIATEAAAALENGEGALVVHTLASEDLAKQLRSACTARGVPCYGAAEHLLAVMEEWFGQRRLGSGFGVGVPKSTTSRAGELGSAAASGPYGVIVASDSSGTSAYQLVRAALRQFPTCGLEEITVCPRVASLEELKLIAQEAAEHSGFVVFTFSSPGMSRFMRRSCEVAGVRYVDLYQPLLMAMELYLEYPSLGVAGGFHLHALANMQSHWEMRPV